MGKHRCNNKRKMANEVNEVIDVFGEGIGELGKNSTDTWWYPKPENQHGKPWITDEATQSELDSMRLIANICLIQCIVALSPLVLGLLIRCLTAGTIDAKSGIAGGVSTLMAVGTGALGISALVINSIEALGGTMALAAVFIVASVFFLAFMVLNLVVTFGCNCLQILCCKCGSAFCDNVCLIFFFLIGVVWIVAVIILDILLIREAWPFVFQTAKDSINL